MDVTRDGPAKEEPAWDPLAILKGDRAGDATENDDDLEVFLIFELQGQTLATSVAHVREILDVRSITPLPNAPHDVEGIIDVRGKGVSVISIAGHLGMRATTASGSERIVILDFPRGNGSMTEIGVRIEAVIDVCQIQDADIEQTPQTLGSWDQKMIRGVTRRDDKLVVLIDLEQLFLKNQLPDDAFDF